MTEVTVPKDERPSYAKYVAYTVIGIFLVNYVIGLPARDAKSRFSRSVRFSSPEF